MSFVNKFKIGNQDPNNVPVSGNSFGLPKDQQPHIRVQGKVTTQQSRPRGGWDDDEEDEHPQIKTTSGSYSGNEVQFREQPRDGEGSSFNAGFENQSKKKVNSATELIILECDLGFIANHEYENNMINELIQPGGARLKQPDKLLQNFCLASENLQSAVIGSLLFCKLGEEIADVSKARTLFLIEALVKKIQKYFDYFKYNLSVLRNLDFSNEGSNASQLEKLKQDIIQHIEGADQSKPTFTKLMNTTTPKLVTTQNLLEDDLLGISQSQKKQDSFNFLNTQQESKLNVGTQVNNPQTQTQPKKLDPFAIGTSNTTNHSQNKTKTTTGPSINFKKFHANSSQEQNKPIIQTQNSQQTNNLIGALSGIDFGEAQSPSLQTISNQNHTEGNEQTKIFQAQNSNGQTNPNGSIVSNNLNNGFNNHSNKMVFSTNIFSGFSNTGNLAMNSQYNSFGGPGVNNYWNNNSQMNYSFNSYPNPGLANNIHSNCNGGYTNSLNLNGGTVDFNGTSNNFISINSYTMTNEKGIDELYNLVHQELKKPEEDKKKKQKEINEKAFDSLKF